MKNVIIAKNIAVQLAVMATVIDSGRQVSKLNELIWGRVCCQSKSLVWQKEAQWNFDMHQGGCVCHAGQGSMVPGWNLLRPSQATSASALQP